METILLTKYPHNIKDHCQVFLSYIYSIIITNRTLFLFVRLRVTIGMIIWNHWTYILITLISLGKQCHAYTLLMFHASSAELLKRMSESNAAVEIAYTRRIIDSSL